MINTTVSLRWALITLALILLLTVPLVGAQQTEPGADVDGNDQATDDQPLDQQPLDEQALDEEEGDDRPAQSDRFIPSEQISQDLGVSYPVDI